MGKITDDKIPPLDQIPSGSREIWMGFLVGLVILAIIFVLFFSFLFSSLGNKNQVNVGQPVSVGAQEN